MRSTRMLITISAIGAVALPTAGAEAASRLTLRVANKAAQKSAASVVKTYSDEDGTTIDSFDLSPCDRDGRRRADCDVTYSFEDGSTCDDTIHVRLGAKGRVKVTADSDDAGDHTFDDCTDPQDTSSDDPGTDDGSTDDGSTGSDDFVPGLPADDGSNS